MHRNTVVFVSFIASPHHPPQSGPGQRNQSCWGEDGEAGPAPLRLHVVPISLLPWQAPEVHAFKVWLGNRANGGDGSSVAPVGNRHTSSGGGEKTAARLGVSDSGHKNKGGDGRADLSFGNEKHEEVNVTQRSQEGGTLAGCSLPLSHAACVPHAVVRLCDAAGCGFDNWWYCRSGGRNCVSSPG